MSDAGELANVLGERQKSAADDRLAAIVERNSDGTYKVRFLLSGAIVTASKANPFDEFNTGTWVIVVQLGASGLAVGAGYSIISRAPRENRGLAAAPLEDEILYDGAVVLSVEPHPVVLETGGPAEEVKIYGRGFLSAPSYGHAEIDDDSAPVVTPDEITLSVKATLLATPGLYELNVEGITVDDVFEIVRAQPKAMLSFAELEVPSASADPYVIQSATSASTSDSQTSLTVTVPSIQAGSLVIVIAFVHMDSLSGGTFGSLQITHPDGSTTWDQSYTSTQNLYGPYGGRMRERSVWNSNEPARGSSSTFTLKAKSTLNADMVFHGTLSVIEVANAPATSPIDDVTPYEQPSFGTNPRLYQTDGDGFANLQPTVSTPELALIALTVPLFSGLNADLFEPPDSGFTEESQATTPATVTASGMATIVASKPTNSTASYGFSAAGPNPTLTPIEDYAVSGSRQFIIKRA